MANRMGMLIEPIYPPSQHILPEACADCGDDVRCDKGFAIPEDKPGTFLCFVCGSLYGWSAPKRWEATMVDYWKEYGPVR